MTKQRKVVKLMEAMECKPVATNSRKYLTFKSETGKLFFIGKSGALRTGTNISSSISISGMLSGLFKKYGI